MQPYPLKFQPLLKQTIWGGRRLGELLGKPIGAEADYAESWEVVDHGADQSVVDNGPLAGKTLAELIDQSPEWLLGEAAAGGRFPLLLKYLDCHRVLSVQVHPDDAYGATLVPPDLGKTEAWYIVAAEPESVVYAGLQPGVDRAALEAAVAAGETEKLLHSFHPEPGDCVFIPAGTVHALGAGLVVAEIQQSSDTTFRLFDWNRLDAEGNSRPLHIERALDVIDYETGPVEPHRGAEAVGGGWQQLVACDKFVLSQLRGGTGELGGDRKFHLLTVPRGRAELRTGDDSLTTLETGQSVLLPAASERASITAADDDTAVLEAQLP